MALTIVSISGLFFLGHLLKWFFQKTKIPDILILTLIGLALGPIFKLITPDFFGKIINLVSIATLVTILFQSGLNFKFNEIFKSAIKGTLLSFLSFSLVGASTYAVTYLLGGEFESCVLIAICAGTTSSSLVIDALKTMNVEKKTKNTLIFDSVLTDVLGIVLFLFFMDAFQKNISADQMTMNLGFKFGISIGIGIAIALFWSIIKNYNFPGTQLKFSNEALCALVFGTLEYYGMSGALGVLSLGLVLGNLKLLPKNKFILNEPVTSEDQLFLNEINFILKTFFFIYLGVSLKFTEINILIVAGSVTLFTFVFRYILVRILFTPKNTCKLDAICLNFLTPKGLTAGILSLILIFNNVKNSQFIQDSIFSIIFFSLAISSISIFLFSFKKIRGKIKFFKAYPEPLENPFPIHDIRSYIQEEAETQINVGTPVNVIQTYTPTPMAEPFIDEVSPKNDPDEITQSDFNLNSDEQKISSFDIKIDEEPKAPTTNSKFTIK